MPGLCYLGTIDPLNKEHQSIIADIKTSKYISVLMTLT